MPPPPGPDSLTRQTGSHLAPTRSTLALPPGASSDVSEPVPDIIVVRERIPRDVLATLVERFFQDMVKYVVDVERGVAAVGGELHADAEAILLDEGSRQQDLWGANYYPGTGPDGCLEYTSLINIRPAQGNRSMEIQDEGMRRRVRDLTYDLIGRGESLS